VIVNDDAITEASTQIFDAAINPLASVIFNLLELQVRKGQITKNEAKFAIAASVDVLSQADVTDAVREVGGDMLIRLVKAIDQIPET
jgi:hypothetical protein